MKATGMTVENFNRNPCYIVPMTGIGQRVKLVRELREFSLQTLADLAGIKAYQTVQDLESGKSKGTKYLLDLAHALGVHAEWLSKGTGPRDLPAADRMSASGNIKDSEINNSLEIAGTSRAAIVADKIKVLGMAECGPDGWALFNGEIVDHVDRPPNVANAKEAYAVFITGDSMEDRYHAGEVAFIHPGKPVTPGAYVLVQRRGKIEGDAPLAVIKRYVKRSGDRVILEQLNPKKTITVPVGEIISMHRVVGAAEP